MTALLVTGNAHLVDAISHFENWLLFHDFSCKKVLVNQRELMPLTNT